MTPVDVKETRAFDASKPFKTRDGQVVDNLVPHSNGYMGRIGEKFTTYHLTGCVWFDGSKHPLDLVNVPDDPAPIAGGERVSAEAMEWANSVADQVQNEIATTDPSTYTPLSEFKEKLREQIGAAPLPTTGEGDAVSEVEKIVFRMRDGWVALAKKLEGEKNIESALNFYARADTAAQILNAVRLLLPVGAHPTPAPRHDGGTVDEAWDAKFVRASQDVLREGLKGYQYNPDEGGYAPNEWERTLIEDFSQGLLFDLHAALRVINRAAHPAQHDHAGGEDEAEVTAALNAKSEELPEGVQYVLLRGLSAMEWALPADGTHDVMRCALQAAALARKGARS